MKEKIQEMVDKIQEMADKIFVPILWFLIYLLVPVALFGIIVNLTSGGRPDETYTGLVILFVLVPLIYFLGIVPAKKRKEKRIKAIADREKASAKAIADREKTIEKEKRLFEEILKMISNDENFRFVQRKMDSIKIIKSKLEKSDLKNVESYIAEGKIKETNERTAKQDEKIKSLCTDENQFKSYKKGQICIGMHIDLVKNLKGQGYDKKRSVTSKSETIKYKYSKFTTPRGTEKYKLEISFQDSRVTAFRDLE